MIMIRRRGLRLLRAASSSPRRCGGGVFLPTLVLVAVVAVTGCGEDGTDDDFNGTIALTVEHADRCDPLDARHCLLPFPSDTFTVADGSTDTGLRINFARESMIANAAGSRLDPTEWNRNDGFSPGAQIATYVAGLDLVASGIVGLADIGGSLVADAPIILLDADTGERRPYWAELDARVASDANRLLLVRPAVNLHDGHRYVVALRHLKTAAGEMIPAGDVFRAYRDRLQSDVPEVEARRARYERVFTDLARAGVAREDLYLAWDFTVASTRNLTERLLFMRDDAFARLDGAAPSFTVDRVEENPTVELRRRVTGTFEVPLYLTGAGEAGERLQYGANGLPAVNGTYPASFVCNVPNAVTGGPGSSVAPARAAVYGHGLFGSGAEIDAGNVRHMANEHNVVFCATKWIGMCEEDVANAAAVLQDLSRFRRFPTAYSKGC